MNQPLLRPLGFGEILDGAFTLYRRNFPTFALTSLVGMGIVMVGFAVFGGSLLIAAAGGMGNGGAAAGAAFGSVMLMMVVMFVSFLVMYGALAHEGDRRHARFYEPVERGLEIRIAEKLRELREMNRKEGTNP